MPANSFDPSTATAAETARAVADGQVSATELCDAAISRIELLDGELNAVVVRDFDRARDAARAADAALARGERRPLLGVPMTVKESHNIAGLPTTWGFEAAKGWTATEDALGVARLKAAGAVILGKTNVPVALADWQSVNPIYGRTHNRWNIALTPGGSSGGAAAAVASGMTPLEFGSDIGGSIRIPAAFCGIYGHKSSYGIIPQRGHAPAGLDGVDVALSVLGPLARSASDLELALDVVAGPSDIEAVGYDLRLPPARAARLGDFRILLLDAYPGVAVEEEVAAGLAGLVERLQAIGAKVERRSEKLPNLGKSSEIYAGLLGATMSRRSPAAGEVISAHKWMELLDAQLMLRRQWRELFTDFDVVLAPVSGVLPYPHVDGPGDKRTLTINGQETPYFAQIAWVGLATVAQLPATSAPIGLSRAGLPLAVQIIGPYLEDRTPIAFARLLEEAFGGFRPPPSRGR